MPRIKDKLINQCCGAVQRDSKLTWFNKIARLFKRSTPNNLYGEKFAHLILYANENVRAEIVTKMLKETFKDSFILVKSERSEEKGKVTAIGSDNTTSDIKRGLHYHCFITYDCKEGVNPDLSFKSTVREMLKNRGKKLMVNKSKKHFRFRGYNIVSDSKFYDQWDVFHASAEDWKQSRDQGIYKYISLPITEHTQYRLLNWLASCTKERTSARNRNCMIHDNRKK